MCRKGGWEGLCVGRVGVAKYCTIVPSEPYTVTAIVCFVLIRFCLLSPQRSSR